MTFHKYSLPRNEDNTYGVYEVNLPLDAQILHVGVQNGIICIWALVTPGVVFITHQIQIVGTGREAPERFEKYLGTVMQGGGTFVWHLFLL
jgi:hypothetical protein